jgi:hypothetical protein
MAPHISIILQFGGSKVDESENKLHDIASASDPPAEEFGQPGKWLEIDGETIVGVHSHRCNSELTWVKYEGDDDVAPGCLWKENKIVKPKLEMNEEQLQAAARLHITDVYPVWKQLNIMRSGDQKEIDKMGRFIDAVRKWSNDPKAKMTDLKNIKP